MQQDVFKSMSVLHSLDAEIEERIQIISSINAHYTQIRNTMRNIERLLKTKRQLHGSTLKSHNTISVANRISVMQEESVLANPALDDILSKAKQIRSGAKGKVVDPARGKDKGIASSKTSSTPSSIISPNDEVFSDVSRTPTVDEMNLNDLLDFEGRLAGHVDCLKRLKAPMSIGELCMPPTDVIINQSRLLSDALGRATFPKSVPYQLLTGPCSTSVATCLSSHTALLGETTEIYTRLKSSFKLQRQQFDRAMKSRLSRISVSQLSKDDIDEVLHAWFKAQKSISMLSRLDSISFEQDAFLASQASGDEHDTSVEEGVAEEIQLLQLGSISSMPLVTPIHAQGKLAVSKTLLKHVSSPDWVRERLTDVDDFHNQLQSNVKYTVEYSIGKYQLRELIRQMKKCCEDEIKDKSGGIHIEAVDWRNTLSQLRDLFCCLVNEASSGDSCHFMHRTS